ncbi:MAG: tetratricopeptide repeat protein, partial [Phycisphaerae bacterium]|nr:tetratricopeptide repeat protein [Phycisphaerae bacterium]
GKNDEALRLYEQAVMLKPQSSELLEMLGSCYVLTKQWGKAAEIHERLYSQSDDAEEQTRYLKTMAIAAENDGDYDAAFNYYSMLTSQDKNNARLWFSMGQAALGADLLSEAIVCSRKVLALSPNMKEAWLLSGSANYKKGNYLEAAEDFQKAADVPEKAEFALLMTGRCYEKLGKDEQAKIAYKRAGQFGTNSELQRLLAKGNKKD